MNRRVSIPRSPFALLPLFVLLAACGERGAQLSNVAQLAFSGKAEAAAAPAEQKAEKRSLWMEYAPGSEPPPGIVPMQSLAPMVKHVKPGVVNINTTSVVKLRPLRRALPPGMQDPFEEFWKRFQPEESRRQSLGSGFIVHPDGYVITNNHVVENATEIKVKLDDGREFSAQTVGRDPKTDVALLKLKGEGAELHDLPTVALGNSDPLEVGDFVLAVGNPFGLDHSVSLGIVSAKERVIGAGPYDEFIQTDAAINPGNSGGPLFNTQGEVIGVNTAIVAHGQGIGFAVPINVVKELLPQLKERGRVSRGWLGVSIQEVTPELARSLKLSQAKGALVAGVMKGSPAEKAEVRSGDVVVAVNGRKVDNFNQLSRFVAFVSPGAKASLTVIRDGKERTIDVLVTERPDDDGVEETGEASDEQLQGAADRIGIKVRALSPQRARALGIDGGVEVASIDPDGAAAGGGAREGDVIVEVQRKSVKSPKEYQSALAALKQGDTALLRLQREKASLYVAVKIPKK